jgi:hypothetical protein
MFDAVSTILVRGVSFQNRYQHRLLHDECLLNWRETYADVTFEVFCASRNQIGFKAQLFIR